MRLRLIGHQTDNGIEVGLGVAGRTHNGNSDRVGSLLDVLHRSGNLRRGHRLSRKRDHTVLHLSVRVRGSGGSGNLTRHSITERLVTIQIHNTTILVTNAQNHSQHLRQRVDVESLSVQLDTVRGARERSLGTRLPVRSGGALSIPIGRNRSHLVHPVGSSSDGRTTQVVVGFVSLIVIEASLQNHLRLRLRNHVVDVHVGIRSPVG